MWLLVGLGNPGSEYTRTRHNAGWLALDAFARMYHASEWRLDKKNQSEVADCLIGGEKVLLVKPQTFMNLSGDAVQRITSYYKIEPHHIIVVHDDLDFPLGTARLQFDRSAAGHNGVQDIIDKLGTQAFSRVRIGIGPKPTQDVEGRDFVLARFTAEELSTLSGGLDKIFESVTSVITGA